ncbi:MAG TPA: ABC transporter substrate-binding protein [Flavipsychrobacter sp.]|nr:ABC transporter substrate-binding protein [Flavipsychrobacter sp.]
MRQTKFIFSSFLLLTLLIASCNRDDKKIGRQNVKIGALLSLTGNWSSLGITSRAAMDIALEDINAYMEETGSRYRFTSEIFDTKLDASLATDFIAEASKNGCKFILGPQSSAEAAAVNSYASANDMLVVSQGSTAGTLSIENDNLFRFCPDDHIEGLAMANTIYNSGIRALITAAREDAGNMGLQTSTGKAFQNKGGMLYITTPYSPVTSNFSALLSEIKTKILQYSATHDTSKIAVYLASFDECVGLFQQAANDPVLSKVRWYGGDGTALSAALIGNATAADFAIATEYFAPAFGLPAQASAKWQPLSEKIKHRTGITPDAFALASYDAVWVMALTYNAYPYSKIDFGKLKAEFSDQASRYYGATGTTMLNAAGDRAVGSYDYWGLEKTGSGYSWRLVGKSE